MIVDHKISFAPPRVHTHNDLFYMKLFLKSADQKYTGGAIMRKAVLIIAGVLFIFYGCSMESPQSAPDGTLNLVFSGEGLFTAKTIEPDLDMDVAVYDIYGSGPNGESFEQTGVTSTLVWQKSLVPGGWTITVHAKNAEGVIIGTGSVDVEIIAGEVTNAEIVVSPLIGEGILDVSVNWPLGVIENPVVMGSITPAGGSSETASFVYGPDGLSARHTQTLANGYSMISIQLYDSDVMLWGTIEAVRIISGELSEKTFTLVKDVNRGGLELEIITDMENPIEIIFSGALEILPSGSNMTVFASTSELVDSYQWYLKGNPISGEIGNTITIGETLEPGTYWLDLVVIKDSILSSEGIVFEVIQ